MAGIQAIKDAAGPADENKPAAFLLTALTVVTGVFASLGVTGGVLGRMVRNHGASTGVAISVGLLAVALGVVAAATLKKKPIAQLAVFLAGIFAFLVAGVAATYAAVGVWGDRTQPRVTAEVTKTASGVVLSLTLKGSGLKVDDRMFLVVSPQGGALARTGALYRATLSPDSDGEIDAAPKIALTPGAYDAALIRAAYALSEASDCYGEDPRATCLTVRLASPERPQLTAEWKDRTTLQVGVDAHDVPGRRLAVRVIGVRGKIRRTISSWTLAPNLNGDLIAKLNVPVPRIYTRVCVVASTLLPEPTCPPTKITVSGSTEFDSAAAEIAHTVWLTLPIGVDTTSSVQPGSAAQQAGEHGQ